MREAQKEDPWGKKLFVMITAILALAYSVTLCVLFKMRWEAAKSRPMYACSYTDEESGDQTIVGEQWLEVMRVAWIAYLTISIISVMTIASAWAVILRTASCGLVFLAQVFQVVVLLWLTAVRFSAAGRSCAERKGLKMFRDDGAFLKNVIFCIWGLGWLHCLLLCCGNIPTKAGGEGETK